MKWEDVKPEDLLIVMVLHDNKPVRFRLTKSEFDKFVPKDDFVQVVHCNSDTHLDLDDVANQFDDWDLNKTAEKVAEWQTEMCRDVARMVSISDQFFKCIDLENRASNEWFWNALPLLDGLMESLDNFSDGLTMP